MRAHKYVCTRIVYLSKNKYICAIYASLGAHCTNDTKHIETNN